MGVLVTNVESPFEWFRQVVFYLRRPEPKVVGVPAVAVARRLELAAAAAAGRPVAAAAADTWRRPGPRGVEACAFGTGTWTRRRGEPAEPVRSVFTARYLNFCFGS